MIEKGLYYATQGFADVIKGVGGFWGDIKHRPIVCLVQSSENPLLFWAIPMGNFKHQTPENQKKILGWMSLPERDIRSCYYHVGRTTNKSLFFISDAFPITDKYIAGHHLDVNKRHYIIKNPNLIAELERKLKRLLALENSNPNSFRQHISATKEYLLNELEKDSVM